MAKKKAPIGCLFWFALMLVVAVVFLLSRDAVQRVMERTGFLALLRGEEAAEEVSVEVHPPSQEDPASGGSSAPPAANGPQVSLQSEPARGPSAGSGGDGSAQPSGTPRPATQPADAQSAPAAARPAGEPEGRARQSRLYFVQVSDDGAISASALPRTVHYADAPLARTLEALLEGPLPAESSQGYLTLIPEGTLVQRLTVDEGTAYISFNESFRFNPFGRQGLVAQLEQIVFTATEFPTVQRVQILIDGKVADYLSPEGIAIREPLSRGSFRDGAL